jgi:SAM-dependent methyltransferase
MAPTSVSPGDVGAGDYWDGVGREWLARKPDALWREYTDRLQISLVDRWLGWSGSPLGHEETALKTDLFDEVAGTGVAHHLLAKGYRTTGIDIAPLVVTEAGRRNPAIDARVADVRELPFDDGSFDVVYSGSTLDHFSDPGQIGRALFELVRVLRPSGRLILTLDNPLNPVVWMRNGPLLGVLRRSGIVPYRVGATLAPAPLLEILRKCGLEILQSTAILHCPRVLAVWRARRVNGRGPPDRERFLAGLARWERLEQWPSRFLSGHFTAILAAKSGPNRQRPLSPSTNQVIRSR